MLIPDGVSIVKSCKWIKAKSQPKERIAGWDLFSFEMEKLERESEELRTKSEESKIVMFMGSSQKVLDLIVKRAPLYGLEWLYRLIKEPKRMWRRYIIGNSLFLCNMVKE